MAYPHEPDPVSRDDRDLDDTSRGRSPWGDSALAALDQYARLVEAQPTPIHDGISGARVEYAGQVDWPARPDDLTADDRYATPTFNGLRPDDLELPQPPQDPNWRPSTDGDR